MKVLITGGFGLIGSRLAKSLLEDNFQVLIGSRNITKFNGWMNELEVVETKWHSEDSLSLACCGVDVIVHAAVMNAGDCSKNPSEAFKCNGDATKLLTKVACDRKVKKFIYLSTAHVYSNPLVGNITEETPTTNNHPYALSHLHGENAVIDVNRRELIEGTVVRLSNAFGAPVNKEANCWMLLVNDLCKQAVVNKQLILKSNGTQHRDFISLSDVCRSIKAIVTSNNILNNFPIINIGWGVSQSVKGMAELIQSRCEVVLGYKPDLLINNLDSNINKTKLFYGNENLKVLNVTLKNENKINEIDNLLNYCRRNFLDEYI